MQPIPMAMMLMPFSCPVVTVTDAHGTDAHTPMQLMPEPYTHAVDAMNQIPMQSIPMAMMLMPFSCPMVTVTDAHGTDAH